MKKRSFLVLGLSLMMLFSFSSIAFGAEDNVDYNAMVRNQVEALDSNSMVIVGPEQEVDKSKYMEAIKDFYNDMIQYQVSPVAIVETKILSDHSTTPCKNALISSEFKNTVDVTYMTDVRFNGFATVTWTGQDPYNADGVNMDNIVTAKGVGLSAGVGTGGFTVSGSSTNKVYTFTKGVSNNFVITHNYNNAQISGALTHIYQNVNGTFRFGSSYYTVGADDNSVI